MYCRDIVVRRTADTIRRCRIGKQCGRTHLVDHQALKGIRHRVEIVDPSEPRVHVANWYGEAGVYDKSKDEDSGRRHGLCQTAGKSTNCSEYHRHGKDAGEGEEIKSKECRRSSAKISHKVQREIEADRRQDLVRKVAYHGSDGLAKWVVERVLCLLFHNRTLCV